MSTKDIKVHYNKQWQAITDIVVWKYSYNALIKDIMKKFLPRGAPVPKFKIVCEQDGQYVQISDNDSLTRCLLFGGDELDIYVEVEMVDGVRMPESKSLHSGVAGVYNTQLGYYVEEVEEPEVVVLDSEEDESDCAIVEEEGSGKNSGENDESHWADGEEEGNEMDDEEVEYYPTQEGNCMFSTDEDKDYSNEESHHTDSNVSLEDEDSHHSDSNISIESVQICSEDGLSGVENDGDRVEHHMVEDDPELEMKLMKLSKANAGTWFRRETDGTINLKAGLLFTNVYHFREVLREYVIQEGFELIRHKNEKSRVTVSCKSEGCPWRLHASPTQDGGTYKIKTCIEEHQCLRKSRFRDATSSWIASKLKEKFAAEPNKSKAGIEQDLKDEFGITGLDPMKIYRAKQIAKTMLYGNYTEQYAKLRAYGELTLKYNPGSIFKVTSMERQRLDSPPVFKRMFVMFDGIKKAFLEGCRPFIGVDGCFLKGRYGGILLSAVGLDGNNGVLPLATCIVEAENRDSWLYFFSLLREAIGDSLDGIPWTIIETSNI